MGNALGIPVVHLDRLYWRPNWGKPTKQEWGETVRRELARDSWIMDGNYGGTREMRIQACDTVILLDIPRRICLYRVLKRSIMYRGKTWPDMADGCNEQIDLAFFLWAWNYPTRSRKKVETELKLFQNKKTIIRLRSTKEVEDFLAKYS